MEKFPLQFNILDIIKEVKDSNFENFEFQYGDLKISISCKKKEDKTISNSEILNTTSDAVTYMEEEEKKNIGDLIVEQDENALSELDYYPELAGELRRSGIVRIGPTGAYEYVEKEANNA